jgi:soluble lytic murein transglycosylase-like protein
MWKLAGIFLLFVPVFAQAGAQKMEGAVCNSASAGLFVANVSYEPVTLQQFVSVSASEKKAMAWLATMSKRLEKHIPNPKDRNDFLMTVYYEATRLALDPQLILGIIQVESGFNKYALSTAGALGYMQVMPFWPKLCGYPDHNLFHLRRNLRYGCSILRGYLKMEKGDLDRALGRYNGSLGQATYPNLVLRARYGLWAYPS